MKYVVLTVLTTLLLAGCSAGGPQFQQLARLKSNQANVYVYRESTFGGNLNTQDIYLDGRALGTLKNGGYLSTPVSPGSHTLKVLYEREILIADKFTARNFVVVPGRNYFFKVYSRETGGVHMTGMVNGVPMMAPNYVTESIPVPQEQALQALQSAHLSE